MATGQRVKSRRLWGRLVVLVIALAVVAALVFAFLPKPVGVDVVLAERGPLRVTVDEDGQTRIRERYLVSTPLNGRLMRIGLDVGAEVTAGSTVIARIEPTDPDLLDPRARAQAEARVKAAEARLQQAGVRLDKDKAELDFAESELARVRKLEERDATTSADVEEQEMLFRSRTEEYKEARFGKEIAEFELELERAALLRTQASNSRNGDGGYFEIRAPITGRVLKVIQESATVVTPGMELVELGEPSDLEIVVDVLSSDAVRIVRGAAAELVQWGGEAPLRATVRLVEPSGFTKISALGVEEQRVNVVLDLEDPPEARPSLGDGFRVEARIVIWEESDVLKVPTSALFRHAGEWAVFVVAQNQARLRAVTVGNQNGLEAQILSGLEADEQVIVHPGDQLSDGVGVFAR